MSHEFPDLPYAYDALEPVIDETTMRVHHTKHHKTYYDKFVDAISGTEMENQSLEDIFATISQQPAVVRNNGGGSYNHIVYWNSMTTDAKQPEGPAVEAIKAKFGSIDEFKDAFTKAAIGQFGSGFAWLVVTSNGELEITSTANQDNPLMDVASVRGKPILGCDVWEHAYYISYQNRRPEYVENWWKLVNWDYVNEQYEAATQ